MIGLVVITAAGVTMALACLRMVLGPTDADRVVALELILSSSLALVAAGAWVAGSARLLDVGLALAAVGFVGTIAWARLVEANAREDGP